MSKLTKRQQRILKYTIGVILYPLAFVIAPTYKLIRKVVLRKQTQVKLHNIVQGFSYLVVKDSQVEAMAKRRAEICSECRWAKTNGNKKSIVVGDKLHDIVSYFCDLCGCSIAGKVRSENEHCPIEKWGPERLNIK